MIWLVSLPIWVLLWSPLVSDRAKTGKNVKAYMFLCSLALILIIGLRSINTGSMDTYVYSLAFNKAKNYAELSEYLMFTDFYENFFLLSEGGFHIFTWLSARIFPDAQWFLLVSAAVIITATSKFISRHSEDPVVSWIVFICLGSMTFAMNGMRQALAMSICLLSYGYAKEKKLFKFLLVVLVAVLFHKSAMIFVLVYFICNMKFNFKSITMLTVGVAMFLYLADRFALLYDSMTGEDYATGDSFESGGVIVLLIYLIAIVGILVFSKKLKEPRGFYPFALIVVGCSLYLGRFISTQIYERISYYFAYFLMLGFPIMFEDMKKEEHIVFRVSFIVLAIALFAYRISKSTFANFSLFF